MSQPKHDRTSNQEASTLDLAMLLSMPIAIAVLLGIIGYLGASI